MNEVPYIFCGSTFFFGSMLLIIFGFFAFLRYMRYRETVLLAEKGLIRADYEGNGKGTLRWGIAITALGIALCVGLYPLGWVGIGNRFPLNFGPWMLAGLIPTFFGLGLVLIWLITSRDKKQTKPSEPPDAVSVFESPDS